MKLYKNVFFALLIITTLLGCDVFQERLLSPKPIDVNERLIGYWEITSIDGESLYAVTEATYADLHFDGYGEWSIYAEWDFGALEVNATIFGEYILDDDFIIITIPEDNGFFDLEPEESFIKGTLAFDGGNRLLLYEVDRLALELNRVVY